MLGSKADNLKVLESLKLAVPEFYVINADALTNLQQQSTLSKLTHEFTVWCKQFDIREVAVRSSADAEDGADKSFAGQFASVMNVHSNEEFIAALQAVYKSRPADSYSSAKQHRMNIIVQRYIEPDVAGVVFTVNPSNGLAEMLINAANGHGAAVVDGKEVATFQVDRINKDIRTLNSHDYAVLTKAQITEIVDLGLKVEQHMGCPQDIEWAIQNNTLYALQTRPITQINHLKVWDNANIGESFPGIVMPLTFSIARRGYELVYKSQAQAGGMSWYQLEANHRTFHDMVGLFGGRMYYNLASWYKFIGLFPSNGRNQKFLDDQLETVGDVVYLPPSTYPFKQKLKFYSKALLRVVHFEREKKQYWCSLDTAFAQYEALPNGLSLPLLLERYTFVEQMIVPQMGRSADNDFLVMTYHGLLKTKLTAWLGKNEGQTSSFLGSLHDVISARQAELLAAIANDINRDKLATKHLRAKNYQSLDTYLLTTTTAPLLKEYRDKFLHRFAGDQKIESVNPLLSHDGFYSLIATYCQLDNSASTARRTAALKAENRRHNATLLKLNVLQRLQYQFLLKRLKNHLRIREHNRLLRGKAYALLRELFPVVGQAMVDAKIITNAHDIYYLDIEEILRFVNGTGYSDDVQYNITARKKRYASYKKQSFPSRFITTNLAYTLPDAMPKTVKTGPALTSLPGTLSSPGDVSGTVIVLEEPIIPTRPFDILVVSHTDPGWTPLIALAKGVIVEHGGMLSHAAIVTRELGIPSIIGVENATEILKNGMRVHIDSPSSSVKIIDT